MPYILEAFGSTPIPQYNGRHVLSTAAATVRSAELASGGAYDLHGDDRAPADAMSISISGWLVGADYLTVFRELRARARERDVLWRLWDDGTREWTPARLLQVPAERGARGIRGIEPTMVFWLPLPLWYTETPGSFIGVDLYDEDEDDLMTMGAEGDAAGTAVPFTIVNAGNLPSTRIVITITAIDTLTDVTLENETTGHELAWAGSLAAGEDLVINAGSERVTVAGDADWSGLTEPPDKERWMELAPGPNTLTFTPSGNATILVTYEHTSA